MANCLPHDFLPHPRCYNLNWFFDVQKLAHMAKFAQMQREHTKLIVSFLAMMVGWQLFDGILGGWFDGQLQIVGSDPIHLTMLCLVKFTLVLAFGALGFAVPVVAIGFIKDIGILKISSVSILSPQLPVISNLFGASFRPPRQFS
jgi:hypothetical protein